MPGETLVRNSGLSPDLPEPKGKGHLAVVGGGPSIAYRVASLRAWVGDIWAINGTWQWCHDHGIEAFLYSIDPSPCLIDFTEGVGRAVLAAHCDPAVFAALADAAVWKVSDDLPGPTSAVAAAYIGLKAGYEHITYFGCESSYGETTHAYRCDDVDGLLRVACNGGSFLTKMELIVQAEQLSCLLREAPGVFSEDGGGFLAALAAAGDYDVTHVPRTMQEEWNV